MTPQECLLATLDCVCLSPVDADKLASGLEKLEICEVSLRERVNFIKDNFDTNAPKNLWWQQPGFIMGGIAVSTSVGFLLGVMSKK